MLIELKNGDTYNGRLVRCDMFMNISLREVICTSKVNAFDLLRSLPLQIRMVTDFGKCLSAIFGVAVSNT
jgi:small nuclear ribonucleoprotein (snRNP)-like protein